MSDDYSVYRILLVDDVADNLFLLETVLAAEGYEVELAHDGYSALDKMEALSPDLVLLDVMMPGLNGYQVTERIRKNGKFAATPILLVSAHSDLDVARGIQLGANGFIRKPVNLDELLTKTKACLVGRTASPLQSQEKMKHHPIHRHPMVQNPMIQRRERSPEQLESSK